MTDQAPPDGIKQPPPARTIVTAPDAQGTQRIVGIYDIGEDIPGVVAVEVVVEPVPEATTKKS